MAGGSQGANPSYTAQMQQLLQQNAGGSMSPSTYASPNQNFMQYPQQGQPNQPNPQPPPFGATPQNENFMQGPDVTGNLPGGGMGFDNSGSDGGVGGQPAPMQSPLQQGNKPLNISQFQQPQGLQIQGNPTSQVVQRPQQR